MNERIKELRKRLDMTQQAFAEKIGIKRNTVAQYEIGRNEPIEAIISSICREFNVNEEWLRTGTGEMFVENDTFSLDEYARQNNLSDIDIEIIKNFMELDASTRDAVYSVFRNVFATKNENIFDEAPNSPDELESKFFSVVPTKDNAI